MTGSAAVNSVRKLRSRGANTELAAGGAAVTRAPRVYLPPGYRRLASQAMPGASAFELLCASFSQVGVEVVDTYDGERATTPQVVFLCPALFDDAELCAELEANVRRDLSRTAGIGTTTGQSNMVGTLDHLRAHVQARFSRLSHATHALRETVRLRETARFRETGWAAEPSVVRSEQSMKLRSEQSTIRLERSIVRPSHRGHRAPPFIALYSTEKRFGFYTSACPLGLKESGLFEHMFLKFAPAPVLRAPIMNKLARDLRSTAHGSGVQAKTGRNHACVHECNAQIERGIASNTHFATCTMTPTLQLALHQAPASSFSSNRSKFMEFTDPLEA